MSRSNMSTVPFIVKMILAIFAATASFSAWASTSVLVGKWNHIKLTQIADGRVVRVQASAGDSSIEYKADGTWVLRSPRNNNSGTWKLRDGNLLETTTVQSDVPNQLGWHSVKQIEVVDTTLKVITKYDAKTMEVFAPRPDGTRPKEMVVISIFERADAR